MSSNLVIFKWFVHAWAWISWRFVLDFFDFQAFWLISWCLIFIEFLKEMLDFQAFYAIFEWFSDILCHFRVIFIDFHAFCGYFQWFSLKNGLKIVHFHRGTPRWRYQFLKKSSRIVRSFLLFSSWCSTVHWTSFRLF